MMKVYIAGHWELEYVPGQKERIKELGGYWNPQERCWQFDEVTEEIREEFEEYA